MFCSISESSLFGPKETAAIVRPIGNRVNMRKDRWQRSPLSELDTNPHTFEIDRNLEVCCAEAAVTGPGLFTFPQTLAGKQAVGRWYGWQNGFANLAGVVGPSLTGFVLQWTGSFRAPFAITAAMCIAGGLAWVLIVGRVEPVMWAPVSNVSVAPISAQA
jgi:hypothetical protein